MVSLVSPLNRAETDDKSRDFIVIRYMSADHMYAELIRTSLGFLKSVEICYAILYLVISEALLIYRFLQLKFSLSFQHKRKVYVAEQHLFLTAISTSVCSVVKIALIRHILVTKHLTIG